MRIADFPEKTCKECGKKFVIQGPHMWGYKKQNSKTHGYTYFCSWGCLRASEKEKETKKMEKEQMKKRPGRKPKAAAVVEISEKLPEDAAIVSGRRIAERLMEEAEAREKMINGIQQLEPAALFSRVLPDGTFKKVPNLGMMLCGANYQIILSAYQWFKLTEEILVAIRQLDVTPAMIGEDQDED